MTANGKDRPAVKINLDNPREVVRLLQQRSRILQEATLEAVKDQKDAETIDPAAFWAAIQRLSDGQAVIMLALAHLTGQNATEIGILTGQARARAGVVLPGP